MRKLLASICGVALLGFLSTAAVCGEDATAPKSHAPERAKADLLTKQGNWRDAFDAYSKLALDPTDEEKLVGGDLKNALTSLQRLGREDEVDPLFEKVVEIHKANWRLQREAAQAINTLQHFGYVVSGKFFRGNHRGGGQYVNSMLRDRVRSLQLMTAAVAQSKNETDKSELANFYFEFAKAWQQGNGYYPSWRMQDLTDLTVLPDTEEGWNYYGGSTGGAPVNADGTPVYHVVPKSFAASTSDGERWRWCLIQAQELNPAMVQQVRFEFASFLMGQFDVQTAATYARYFGAYKEDGAKQDAANPFVLSSLSESETIAKLATGVKRFALPDEYNFIKLFQQNANERGPMSEASLNTLAQIFTNRQQYEKAADYWQRSIKEFGGQGYKQAQLNQIIGNWGMFEGSEPHASGVAAQIDFRFRNGKKVAFEAQDVNVKKLLDDVKAYLNTKPQNNLDWQRINLSDIGSRLIQENQAQYLGAQAAAWTMDLDPLEKHFDRRVSVITPLKKAGAYLLTAKMEGGNVSRVLLWIDDTALVQKQMDKSAYYFIADAASGKPVPNATVEFFGYRQNYIKQNQVETLTDSFTETADADGQLIPKHNLHTNEGFNWLITATTPDGRFAYSGFNGVWFGTWYDQEYNQTKVYTITDRPAYRPNQAVKFKLWVGQAKYDLEGKAASAGFQYNVQIHNPKNEKIFEKQFTADEFGGFDGEFQLPKDADLGEYYIMVPGLSQFGFRVEEYKKPEFEVKVDAPTEPVMLGEKITATLNAKYYFGAPVTDAKVKYKVSRTSYSANWYPQGRWDWLFNPGYWWFAYDYDWYPGFGRWGMHRPHFSWWWGQNFEQPEIVMESETAIGADGTLKIEIDTGLAKAIHANTDHKYEISAEVTDASRRTITGTGTVMVARQPFKVYAWLDRGHYHTNDDIGVELSAQTLDNKPVVGKGVLKLLKVTYGEAKEGEKAEPIEKEVQSWDLNTDAQGKAHQQLKASEGGQFRVSYTVTDEKGHAIEGGYVFTVIGAGFNGSQFRFNDLELVTDKREYKPGDTVQLMINTDRPDTTVLLFIRPSSGVCLAPKVLRMAGKSVIEPIAVIKKDMPNFFVEALTVSDARVHTEMREVIVPPESRVLNVEVKPTATSYKPGEKASVDVKVTEQNGEPFSGSAVLTVYDKAVEYISGGSKVPDIKKFYWEWRRTHQPGAISNFSHYTHLLLKQGEVPMGFLGVFGDMLMQDEALAKNKDRGAPGNAVANRKKGEGFGGGRGMAGSPPGAPMAASKAMAMDAAEEKSSNGASRRDEADGDSAGDPGEAPPAMVEATVRKNFADTAYWGAALKVGADGTARAELTMPENLTTWKFKVWTMGMGTRVGQGEAEAVTTKNLLVRLQAPRFFTQKDEVVISANVHNYLKTKKHVQVSLEIEGGVLDPVDGARGLQESVDIDPTGEKRIDWRVKVIASGQAMVLVKALTDEESDAMQMVFPAYIHGMEKVESFSGNIRPENTTASLAFTVPAERRPEDSRVEVRYSPTLAGAMVDAIPYLVDYPYGCTEQTISRFLPAVITQKVLLRMNLDLKDIKTKITNLNAQEIGDDEKRAAQWGRDYVKDVSHAKINPVFDDEELKNRVKAGITRLQSLQLTDGGWGWFGGWGEYASAHETAYVVHGLQIGKSNDVAIDPNMLERGQQWLKNYEASQMQLLRNAATETHPYKLHADNLDAFVAMVLTDAKAPNKEMIDRLYTDKNFLTAYGKAVLGLILSKQKDAARLGDVLKNLDQYLTQDEENQTAYLKLPEDNPWWNWYGSEFEAQGYYLKLLAASEPKSEKTSRLVKYVINNRKHATYWNSTRDTAICVEALADYLTASGEDNPDMKLEILVDGKKAKEVEINASNLFSFDNKLVITGKNITSGKHTVEFKKTGKGPIYFNAYVTNFTMEDHITKAGLEVKVDRKYYKLIPVDKKIKAEGDRGQSVDQKVEKYERQELPDLSMLKSGDLVEVELSFESKNDYEYILFEDMKPAGFEPVDVQSGYTKKGFQAYMELRDERVCFFCRTLPRGNNSIAYRMRAEIPGSFNALPTKATGMYAPELRANSDEIKLNVKD